MKTLYIFKSKNSREQFPNEYLYIRGFLDGRRIWVHNDYYYAADFNTHRKATKKDVQPYWWE